MGVGRESHHLTVTQLGPPSGVLILVLLPGRVVPTLISNQDMPISRVTSTAIRLLISQQTANYYLSQCFHKAILGSTPKYHNS